MTQESKDLLLKDLCARLPYGVKIEVVENDDFSSIEVLDCYYLDKIDNNFYKIKPYLFPLSSMREEDFKSLFSTIYNDVNIKIEVSPAEDDGYYGIVVVCSDYKVYYYSSNLLNELDYIGYEWLNAHHYDYRGLIKKGLAIDARGLNLY